MNRSTMIGTNRGTDASEKNAHVLVDVALDRLLRDDARELGGEACARRLEMSTELRIIRHVGFSSWGTTTSAAAVVTSG